MMIKHAGALAILVGSTLAAGARDLPRGEAAARPATGCEAMGPGFHKVEGSDTCIRIGGQVRLETSVATPGGWMSRSRRR